MMNERIGTTLYRGASSDLPHPLRVVVLVPEAPLILLLGAGFAVFGSPLLAAATATLAVAFFVRAAALYIARSLVGAGRHRDAEALARVALTVYPWSADALALRGTLLISSSPAEAEPLLRRSLALLPGRAAVHAALSGALLERGRHTEAAAEARRALELDRSCAVAYLHLAQADIRAGASPTAVEDWLRAGLSATRDAEMETMLRCALAWHLVGQERCAEARLATSGVEATLQRCGDITRSRLRVRLCELLVAQGQTERARELLSSCAAG
ncbi:MAG: hypothetical protein RLZZ387_199 [Chloroflexota bacterium]